MSESKLVAAPGGESARKEENLCLEKMNQGVFNMIIANMCRILTLKRSH